MSFKYVYVFTSLWCKEYKVILFSRHYLKLSYIVCNYNCKDKGKDKDKDIIWIGVNVTLIVWYMCKYGLWYV